MTTYKRLEDALVDMSSTLKTKLTLDEFRARTGLVKGMGVLTLKRLYPSLKITKNTYKGTAYLKIINKDDN